MDFNELVKLKIAPIMQTHGFAMSEEYKNFVEFSSSLISIRFAYSEYEFAHYVAVGRKSDVQYELNDELVAEVWGMQVPVNKVTTEVFLNNIAMLFQKDRGIALLQGNIDDIESWARIQSKDYTNKILLRQTIEASERAWESKNYSQFINLVNEFGLENLPKSHQIKYGIAEKAISK